METGINWDAARQELDGEAWDYDEWGNLSRRVYLGTVFALTPSGKYYTAFASGNVQGCLDLDCGKCEACQDEAWWSAAEQEAESRGMYISTGEYDPCDVFIEETP